MEDLRKSRRKGRYKVIEEEEMTQTWKERRTNGKKDN